MSDNSFDKLDQLFSQADRKKATSDKASSDQEARRDQNLADFKDVYKDMIKPALIECGTYLQGRNWSYKTVENFAGEDSEDGKYFSRGCYASIYIARSSSFPRDESKLSSFMIYWNDPERNISFRQDTREGGGNGEVGNVGHPLPFNKVTQEVIKEHVVEFIRSYMSRRGIT